MIEVVAKEYLESKLLNVPVFVGTKPTNKSEYVLIRNLDSGRANMIDVFTLNFMCFSTSLIKSAELNLKVKKALFDMISLANVSSCKYGGGGQNNDTTTKEYAYDCVFNITYMEE